MRDPELEKTGTVLPSNIPDIQLGRGEIEKQITERTRQKIADFGIELLDERFKRSKYNPAVAEKIIERMSSERHQIAARFRSEGHGEAANISGQKESEVASILSSANRDALKIEGEADAEAARIYASAYSAPDAQDLYLFLRSLDVARSAFEKDTTAVISTNSDLGRILKSMGGSGLGSAKGNGFSVGFVRKVNAIVSGECTRRRVPIASPRHHVAKEKSAMARRAIGPSPTGGCTRGGCAPRNKMRLQPVRNS